MPYLSDRNYNGINYKIGSGLYGTCSTSGSTAAKVVTLPNFNELTDGVTIHVKFTNTNTVATPTLNVNSTGAKPIYLYGDTAVGIGPFRSWMDGSVVTLTYAASSNAWYINNSQDEAIYSNSISFQGVSMQFVRWGHIVNVYMNARIVNAITTTTGENQPYLAQVPSGCIPAAGTGVAIVINSSANPGHYLWISGDGGIQTRQTYAADTWLLLQGTYIAA